MPARKVKIMAGITKRLMQSDNLLINTGLIQTAANQEDIFTKKQLERAVEIVRAFQPYCSSLDKCVTNNDNNSKKGTNIQPCTLPCASSPIQPLGRWVIPALQ